MNLGRIMGGPRAAKRFFACLLMLVVLALPLFAETPAPGTDGQVDFVSLGLSIDQAILREKDLVEIYRKELAQLHEGERTIGSELAALSVQYSIHSNLLIIADTPVKTLEQAFSSNVSAQNGSSMKLSSFREKRDRVHGLLAQTDDQIRLNADQLKGISSDTNQNNVSRVLVDKLKELLKLLNRKKAVLEQLASLYDAYVANYSEIQQQFSALSDTFSREINIRKKQDLFQRKKNVIFTKNTGQMREDLAKILTLPDLLTNPDTWNLNIGLGGAGLDSSGLVIMGLLFLFLQYALFKGYKNLPRLKSRAFFQKSVWASVVLRMTRQSLFLAGNILFLIICDSVSLIRVTFPLIVVIEQILTVVLLSRWLLDFLKYYPSDTKEPGRRPRLDRLKTIVRMIRFFAVAYVLGLWLLDGENVLLFLIRMVFAAVIYIKMFAYAKYLVRTMDLGPVSSRSKTMISVLPVGVSLLMFAGMMFDLGGYTTLVLLVSASLGKTVVVMMWGAVFFKMLKDYQAAGYAHSKGDSDDGTVPALNAHWFLTLVYNFIWFVCLLVAVIYVWGGKQAVLEGVYAGYTTPVHLGNMSFSLMGLSAALVFLVMTHAAARFWRELLQKRLLNDSGMDIGVQESIATISTYLLWAIGILMALNVFGLNMTSITVVLGALGIGLGFGLQNIFNNFLSGIILLFERPIQVGDDVEINGIWATVRKINVRSTVVQTYDNATLIIPNSDFISNQVTNWSFKDKRLRRKIVVGVAYGSDLELVRTTLFEAAAKHPKVLQLPKPDVIFSDFGDSSLMFMVRFWTRVEYFYTVESAIRFEIDRLFRERAIEISFPQMDLHLRSLESNLVFNHADTTPSVNAGQTGTPKPDAP